MSGLPLVSHNRDTDPLEVIGQLSVSFLSSELAALKSKVAGILDGNIRLGFSGPKSCLVSSDSPSGTQPHIV